MESDTLNSRVTFRTRQQDRDRIECAAHLVGASVSEWCRTVTMLVARSAVDRRASSTPSTQELVRAGAGEV